MRFVAFLVAAFLAAPLSGDGTARVSGEVVTAGVPLPGSTIQLSSPTFSTTVISGVDGRYVFADVPPGTFDLRIELSGMSTVGRRVTVVAGLNAIGRDELEVVVPEAIIFSCGSPCADEPESEWDRPSCDEYEMNDALIEALGRGDRSALALLQRHHDITRTYDERHRIAAALLRHVSDDSRYWNELATHAENAVRFAQVDEKYTDEFTEWCARRGWDADIYRDKALAALTLASNDRRSRPLLLRAMATDDVDLVSAAIAGFASQHDETMLPLIEKTLTRLSDHASRLAFDLFGYGTDAADDLARRFLDETARESYDEWRAAR